jgi:hypothetical protein
VIAWLNANRRQFRLRGPLLVYDGYICNPRAGAILTGVIFAFEFRRLRGHHNDNEGIPW